MQMFNLGRSKSIVANCKLRLRFFKATAAQAAVGHKRAASSVLGEGKQAPSFFASDLFFSWWW